jgi:hypothetical protein
MSNDKPCYFSVRIERDVDEVYRFITYTSKLGLWAQGLRSAAWEPSRTAVGESSAGPIEVCFTDQVDLGICDLSIVTPDGQVIGCPMRVVRDGTSSEVVFTLRPDAVADREGREQLGAAIAADLNRLRRAIEHG